MPPTPIWKMRSLLFLLICARPGQASAARPAVRTEPVRRKVRRVTGEMEEETGGVFIMCKQHNTRSAIRLKKKHTCVAPAIQAAESRSRCDKFHSRHKVFS